MPDLPDADRPEELFNRTLDHLHQVNTDPAATWLDQERALAAALEVAVLTGIANAQPPPSGRPLPSPRRTTMPDLPSPTATQHEPTIRAMTVRELIHALATFASSGELPRGLDTPVEVGLTHPEDNTLETYAAIQIDRATGIWPGRADDGTDCRHTTVQLTGEPNHPDADRYNSHPLNEHPDWEDPR